MFGRTTRDPLELLKQETIDEIAWARQNDQPAVFHGGCCGCFWQAFNTTMEGIRFCAGCKFFEWDKGLPNRSRKAEPEEAHRAKQARYYA